MQESSRDLPPCPPDCKLIPLSQGKFAIVDASRFEELNVHKWYYHKGYAIRHGARTPEGFRRKLYMHRVVFGTPDGVDTDHKNGDRCDNRIENLRLCNHAQNQQNRGPQPGCRSGIKGVDFFKPTGKWRVRIKVDGKVQYLGHYFSKEEAAAVYAAAAKKWHGEFARCR